MSPEATRGRSPCFETEASSPVLSRDGTSKSQKVWQETAIIHVSVPASLHEQLVSLRTFFGSVERDTSEQQNVT